VRALTLRPLSEYTNPAAYLRRTILNLASNAHRSSGRARRALHRLAGPAQDPVHYPSDLQDLLQLAPVQRTAVYLAVIEGLPHAAIAETLGCSEAAARNRVFPGPARVTGRGRRGAARWLSSQTYGVKTLLGVRPQRGRGGSQRGALRSRATMQPLWVAWVDSRDVP
jgi:Sigma-70, region 4